MRSTGNRLKSCGEAEMECERSGRYHNHILAPAVHVDGALRYVSVESVERPCNGEGKTSGKT